MTAKEGIQDRFQLKVELTFQKEFLCMSCMIMPIICNIKLIILTIIGTIEDRLNQKNSFTFFKSVIKDRVISSYIFELAIRPFMQYPILELNCAHMHIPAYPVSYQNLISVIETYEQEIEVCFTLWASK